MTVNPQSISGEELPWVKYAEAVDVLNGRATYSEWPKDAKTQQFIALTALETIGEGRAATLTVRAFRVEDKSEGEF